MPTRISARSTVSIDGGPPLDCEVTIEREYHTVVSATANRPDPDWTYVDKWGHFHAWSGGSRLLLPTLRPFEVPCDGACGDPAHKVTAYECRICDEPVIPGYVPDWEARAGKPVISGTSASIVVYSDQIAAYAEGAHSLRVFGGPKEMFGIGQIVDMTLGDSKPDQGTFCCNFLTARM